MLNPQLTSSTDVDDGGFPPVLTVDEVAVILRVDRKTAYAVIAEGALPGVRRFGRCIRVSRDALLDWLGRGDEPKQVRARRA